MYKNHHDDAWTSRTRHARVWLSSSWTAGLRSALTDGDRALVDAWVRAGHPVVATRQAAADDATASLGLATTPTEGRRRIAFAVAADAVARVAAPLRLDDAIGAAPDRWQAPLRELVEVGDAMDAPLRVYGSLAWQAASSLDYMTASSDVDLLWDARDEGHARRVVAALIGWESRHALRLDGEARLDDGGFVSWRELATSSDRVLVKTGTAVSLVPHPWRRTETVPR